MPRGGSRLGAGAPKGNLNALKYGRHSKRLKDLLDVLAQVPELRHFLNDIRRRQLRQDKQAARMARRALLQLLLSSPDKNNPLVAYLLATHPDSPPHAKSLPGNQSQGEQSDPVPPLPSPKT